MGKALIDPSTCIREFVFGGYQEYLSHHLSDFNMATPIVREYDFSDCHLFVLFGGVCNLNTKVECGACDTFNRDGGNGREVFVIVQDELLIVIDADYG